MAIKPIIFSAPMIQALLDGRKTQTRRVLKNMGRAPEFRGPHGCQSDPTCWGWMDGDTGEPIGIVPPPQNDSSYDTFYRPYAPGDFLYVREAWKPHSCYAHLKPRDMPDSLVFYAADNGYAPSNTPWKPGIHQPRWASRLTLEVTDVRVERVQDISEDDAKAEGVESLDSPRAQGEVFDRDDAVCGTCGGTRLFTSYSAGGAHFDTDCTYCDTHAKRFRNLWNSINEKRGYGWDTNPWVAAISFKVHHKNIDALLSEKEAA